MARLHPGKSEIIAWGLVTFWSLLIFLTIPFARAIQRYVSAHWGRPAFGYAVIVIIGVATVVVAAMLIRPGVAQLRRGLRPLPGRLFWIAGVAALFILYTLRLMKRAPEEAMHFVQYGVLGVLLFRAFSHRTHDLTIYPAAILAGSMVGMLDEAIQWITPRRYWGIDDIGINALAVVLVQIGIAGGFAPGFIARKIALDGLRRLVKLTMAAATFLALCLLNTPDKIEWYSRNIPGLGFLQNAGVMTEYGYLYEDEEIGRFRSRLSPTELRRADSLRGEEAGAILQQWQGDDERYGKFLNIYSPASDPFLHEARVHLFRRDRYLQDAAAYPVGSRAYREMLTIVYRENRIMEKYFPNTLRHSGYAMSPDTLALLQQYHLPQMKYESGVSKHLFTAFGQKHVLGAYLVFMAGLLMVHRRFRRQATGKTETNSNEE